MLKKQRHKHAKGKRIAAVRLDLDDPGGYSSSGFNRKELFWKIAAVLMIFAALAAVITDYGWGKLSTQISDFVQGVGKGAHTTVSEMSTAQTSGVSSALDDVAELQGEAPVNSDHTSSIFYPNGSSEAISRIQLAMDTANVGLISQAMILLDEALIIDPDVTGIDFIKGSMFAKVDKSTQAREFFLKAKDQKETHFLAHFELAKLELNEKNYAAAVQYFAEVRKLKPRDSTIASLYSSALRLNQQLQEGLFEAQAAQQLNPELRALKVTAILAAIQAGTYEPTPDIQAIIESPEMKTSVSPYDLVVAAGWEYHLGKTERAQQYWQAIQPHFVTMTSLKELQQDPLFQLPAPQRAEDVAETPNAELPSKTHTNDAPVPEFAEDIPEPEMSLDVSKPAETGEPANFLDLSNILPDTP